MSSTDPKSIPVQLVPIVVKEDLEPPNTVQLTLIPAKRDASPKRDSAGASPPESPGQKKVIRSSRRDPIPGGENATLPRWQILTISSAEFEKLASEFKNTNPQMTIAETKELQRQRRLVRNRESAAESRNKRKAYMSQLETTTKSGDQEKTKLIDDVTLLRAENSSLKERSAMLERDIQLLVTNQQTLQNEISRLNKLLAEPLPLPSKELP